MLLLWEEIPYVVMVHIIGQPNLLLVEYDNLSVSFP